MKTVGFIDYYLDEFHANNYPKWLQEASGGELEVRYAWAKIDSPLPGGQTTKVWCQKYGIEELSSIEELIAKSDCINVLSPDNPEMHGELCAQALKSGKPVYVDKTFAQTAKEATALFVLAESHGTPCFSASALRFAGEFEPMKKLNVKGLVSYGPGPLESYSIHQIEPILMLMGTDVLRVRFTGSKELPAAVIEYKDGRLAHMSHHGWDCPFSMLVDGEKTEPLQISSDFFGSFMQQMAKFFLTAKIPVSHKETIAVMRVREALLKAFTCPDNWVAVN